MEKEFLRILLARKKGAVPAAVVRELKWGISNDELDAFVESLYAREMIVLHKQDQSGSVPKYDLIVLTEDGREIVKDMLKE